MSSYFGCLGQKIEVQVSRRRGSNLGVLQKKWGVKFGQSHWQWLQPKKTRQYNVF